MGIFGWDLPPGCTMRMLDPDEGPCDCCGNAVDTCICQECPECSSQGDTACYQEKPVGHGLKFNAEQLKGQTRLKIHDLKEQIADHGVVG